MIHEQNTEGKKFERHPNIKESLQMIIGWLSSDLDRILNLAYSSFFQSLFHSSFDNFVDCITPRKSSIAAFNYSDLPEQIKIHFPALKQRIDCLESILRGQTDNWDELKDYFENEIVRKDDLVVNIKKENKMYLDKIKLLEKEMKLAEDKKIHLQEILDQKKIKEEQTNLQLKKREEEKRFDEGVILDLKKSLDKEMAQNQKLISECENLTMKLTSKINLNPKVNDERHKYLQNTFHNNVLMERRYQETNNRAVTEIEKIRSLYLDKENRLSKTVGSIEGLLKKKDDMIKGLSGYLEKCEARVNGLQRELNDCIHEVRREREEKKTVEARYIYQLLEVNVELKESKEALRKLNCENEYFRCLLSAPGQERCLSRV